MNKKKNTREQTTLRLPPDLFEELKNEAAERGMSVNTYILTLIYKARLHQPE